MNKLKTGIKEAIRILTGARPAPMAGEFELASLPKLLGKDDPVILDIGCNDGTHTLEFLRLFANSKVYAFEPDPRASQSFRANVNSSRAKLFELAISDNDGTAVFHVSDGAPSTEWEKLRPKGWDMSGSIRKPREHLEVHPWCVFSETISVTTKRLDTWCHEEAVDSIDLIWADVQGAEEDLIRGAADALCRTRYLYTEYSDRELYEGQIDLREILTLLPQFEVLYRFSNDVLLRNKTLN